MPNPSRLGLGLPHEELVNGLPATRQLAGVPGAANSCCLGCIGTPAFVSSGNHGQGIRIYSNIETTLLANLSKDLSAATAMYMNHVQRLTTTQEIQGGSCGTVGSVICPKVYGSPAPNPYEMPHQYCLAAFFSRQHLHRRVQNRPAYTWLASHRRSSNHGNLPCRTRLNISVAIPVSFGKLRDPRGKKKHKMHRPMVMLRCSVTRRTPCEAAAAKRSSPRVHVNGSAPRQRCS